MKKNILFTLLFFSTNFAFCQEDPFVALVKKTASVYSGSMSIDDDNPGEVLFETVLTGQKVFLMLNARKLETTSFTLLNNDPILAKKVAKSIEPPTVALGESEIMINDSLTPTSTCNGSDVSPTDVSCVGKKCTISQRIISQCNQDNCWDFSVPSELFPWDDRALVGSKFEMFKLSSKIDITDCLPANLEGTKYRIKFVTTGVSAAKKAGGTIQYSLILQNDTAGAKRAVQ